MAGAALLILTALSSPHAVGRSGIGNPGVIGLDSGTMPRYSWGGRGFRSKIAPYQSVRDNPCCAVAPRAKL